jgi:hypothetical protein
MQKSLPMFEPLESTTSQQASMSFSAASPVRTFQWQGTALAWKPNALVFGGSLRELLAKLDPVSLSWRMLQQSLLMEGVEAMSLRRLPDWGMTADGELYRLLMQALPTSATDGFAWPTPMAADWQLRQPPEEDSIHVTKSGQLKLDTGHRSQVRLSQTALYYQAKQDWHTLIANDSRKSLGIELKPENGLSAQVRWATLPLTANVAKNNASPSQWERNAQPLDVQVQVSKQKINPLNPEWCEMLMGFPPNWTAID